MAQHPSMYCQVKLNNVDITDKVIAYNREHKICTGIGMLTLELTYEMHDQIGTWDHIMIYETSGKEGSYYVNQIEDSKPSATITVTAQDNSKRMTDYFIADTYIITYPTYTRTWIEKFLTEMGINYEFKTTEYGSMLSNNTQLGMMSGYEQIIQLLQLSGWYIYFTPADKAIIGKLNETLNSKALFNRTNITAIKVITHDKLLRNRVVVWGKKHPVIGWITGEAKKKTKWNYDANDFRSMVISNSSIPTFSVASDLANKALAEFTKANQEVHISAYGGYGLNVGNFVTVRAGKSLWNGKGMITTFGTSLSKSGFQTNVILNERCPRLFAFFDLGDYVYISTAESGVWRKRIQYGDSWEDYSDGLDEMCITDLHVSAGVLSAVTQSGKPYSSIADFSGWTLAAISGIDYQKPNASGILENMTIASGLMTRATIVDRMSNYAKYAIDTSPWNNSIAYEPYPSGLMDQIFASGGNGILLTHSGFNMDDMRSWVVTYDTFSGQVIEVNPVSVLVSGFVLGEAVKAVSSSVIVFDIENDGVTDYLSAMVKGPGKYSFTSAPPVFTYDINNKLTLSGMILPSGKYPFTKGEVFNPGKVVNSGVQYVHTPVGSVFQSYYIRGLPQYRVDGQYERIYKDKSDNAYTPNGPWDYQFYSINGNPTFVYNDVNGLNLLEMSGLNTVSGFVLTPKHTYTTGIPTLTNSSLLGTVKVSDTQFDLIYAKDMPDENAEYGSVIGIWYTSLDVRENKVITQPTYVGNISCRYPESATFEYGQGTSSKLDMLRVENYLYFTSFSSVFTGDLDETGEKIFHYYLTIDIVDMLRKTVKTKYYSRHQYKTGESTASSDPVINTPRLYQIKNKVGLAVIYGYNNSRINVTGDPTRGEAFKNKTVYLMMGEAKYGAFPEINIKGVSYMPEQESRFITLESASWGMGSDAAYSRPPGNFSLHLYKLNPNVVNLYGYQTILKTLLDPDVWPQIFHVSNWVRNIGVLDDKFFELNYEDVFADRPPGTEGDPTDPILIPDMNRPHIVSNPNQYYGYGFMTDKFLAGYTEGATFNVMHTFDDIPADWERLCLFATQDSLSSGVYALMRSDRWEYEIWEFREDGTTITGIPYYGMPSGWRYTSGRTFGVAAMNFFVVLPYAGSTLFNSKMVINYYHSPLLMSGYTFATLERTISGYVVMDYYDKVPRLDISKYSPILVGTDSTTTLQTVYGTATTLDITSPKYITSSGTYNRLTDFRYADFAISGVQSGVVLDDSTLEDPTYSGLMTERRVIFSTPSGIYYSPIDNIDYSTPMFEASGSITQIETTNNSFDYQYIFIAASGDDGMFRFYQKDNSISGYFYECPSGLPQSYVTRIRVDDLV